METNLGLHPSKSREKSYPVDLFSIFQTSEYPFSPTLIVYSNSGCPAISTGLQNTMDACASNHLPPEVWTDKINVFVDGYSLVCCMYTKTIMPLHFGE